MRIICDLNTLSTSSSPSTSKGKKNRPVSWDACTTFWSSSDYICTTNVSAERLFLCWGLVTSWDILTRYWAKISWVEQQKCFGKSEFGSGAAYFLDLIQIFWSMLPVFSVIPVYFCDLYRTSAKQSSESNVLAKTTLTWRGYVGYARFMPDFTVSFYHALLYFMVTS